MSGPGFSRHPVAALLGCAALAAYLAAALRLRGSGRGWSGWRTASFAIGVGTLLVALSPWPVAEAHHDLPGHMVRHLLIGMLAPLGLVLGAPATLVLRTLPVGVARRVVGSLRRPAVRWLTHPASALLLDTGALYLLYLTPLYAMMLASPALQAAVHLHFLMAGCLFAWATVGPDPAPHRPGMTTRLMALGAAIAAHSTLARIMYAYQWPRGTGDDAEQIRAAAQLMYYGGDVAELALLIALFGGWYRRRRRGAVAPAGDASSGPPLLIAGS